MENIIGHPPQMEGEERPTDSDSTTQAPTLDSNPGKPR